MDKIFKIKDPQKLAFALGFRHVFNSQAQMNRSDIAAIAGVHPSVITCVINGHEDKFPSRKAQNRISKALNTNIENIVSIGNRILAGQKVNFNFEVKPKHADPETQEFLDHFNLPDPNLSNLSAYEKEILKLCRSFENNEIYLQDLFNFIGDMFVAYQADKANKKIKRGYNPAASSKDTST